MLLPFSLFCEDQRCRDQAEELHEDAEITQLAIAIIKLKCHSYDHRPDNHAQRIGTACCCSGAPRAVDSSRCPGRLCSHHWPAAMGTGQRSGMGS